MNYKNIFDSHLHSINSFDGNDSCDSICQSVIDKGGIGLAITDHVDIDGNDFNTEKQFDDIIKSKDKFDNLKIIAGIELGQGIYQKEKTLELLNKYDYDFVLGSIHNLENMEDFYFLDYKKYDYNELLNQYFNDLLKLVQWNKIDSLAHLTYPLRYIVAREHIKVDMTKYDEVIESIFLELIKNDKALELNTSGLFMDINDTLPNKKYIKMYHNLGGKYITVGSDSHYANMVCQGINVGYDILRECGYSHFTIFEKRNPVLLPIK